MQQFKNVEEKLKQIKILALDVDGVLTSGELIYTASGEFIKIFNVKDGQGLKSLQKNGIIVVIITSRKSEIVSKRMKELGIKYVYQGVEDKLNLIEELTGQFMCYWNDIAYMGDDLVDVPVLEKAGFAACPADAALEAKAVSDYITKNNGGKAAVREVSDMILKAKQ